MSMETHHLHIVEQSSSLSDESRPFESDLAPGVPDIRVSTEQATELWKREVTAYVVIEIPEMDRGVLKQLVRQIWKGIGDRGACDQVGPRAIAALYMTYDDGPEQQAMLQKYANALLEYLHLPQEALLESVITKESLPEEDREIIDDFYGGPVTMEEF